MKDGTLYKGLKIEAQATELHGLWTWRCWVEKLGEFVPERPEIHHSAESALSLAIANGKRRIDDGFICL